MIEFDITGKILDFQDDYDNQYFTKIAQSASFSSVPNGEVSSPDVVSRLPEEYFGIIIMDRKGRRHRKFPLYSAADSWLAAKYFFNPDTQHLPRKAKLMLANNIYNSIKRQSLNPANHEASAGDSLYRLESFVKENLSDIKLLEENHRNIFDMNQEDRTAFNEKSLDDQFSRSGGKPIKGKHTCGSEDRFAVIVKAASKAKGVYRLNTPDDFEKAENYFSLQHDNMPIGMRREFACNMVKHAEAIDYKISEENVLVYAGEDFTGDWKENLTARKRMIKSAESKDAIDGVIKKVASGRMSPEQLFMFISEFDEIEKIASRYGIDLLNPVISVFEKRATEDTVIEVIDGNGITEASLKKLVSKKEIISDKFGEDMAEEFASDPVAVFKSLPTAYKKVFAEMI